MRQQDRAQMLEGLHKARIAGGVRLPTSVPVATAPGDTASDPCLPPSLSIDFLTHFRGLSGLVSTALESRTIPSPAGSNLLKNRTQVTAGKGASAPDFFASR
jgi:hypothetical protein